FALAIEPASNSLRLLGAYLVFRGIIEINEINSVAYPMKVGSRLNLGRIVFEALFFQFRPIKVFSKLFDKLGPRLRGCSLVVSDSQEKRSISPGFDLVCDEVVPRMLFVIC